MKNLTIISLLLISSIVQLNAQFKLNIGLGPTYTNSKLITHQSYGICFNAAADIELNNKFMFSPGFQYDRRRISYETYFTDTQGYPITGGQITYVFHYINIPLLIKLNIGENGYFQLCTGYMPSILMSVIGKTDAPDTQYNFRESLEVDERINHGWVFGAQGNIPCNETWDITMNLSYNYLFSSINDVNVGVLYLMAGVRKQM